LPACLELDEDWAAAVQVTTADKTSKNVRPATTLGNRMPHVK